MNVLKRVALFAINNPQYEKGIENTMRLSGIEFKKVLGSYNGNVEDSYVAIIDDDNKLDEIFDIAAGYSQETILVVDEDRKAYLHDVLTGDVDYIGYFEVIDALQVKELESWTLDGTTYYGVIKRRA